MVFRKGDKLAGVKTPVSYRVQAAHRDGTVTVKALFPLTSDGIEAASGYHGFVYRHQPAEAFRPYTEKENDR